MSESADDVIGFIAIEFQHRNLESLAQPFDVRDGGEQLLGCGIALSLVSRKFDVSGRGCVGIKSDAEVGGLLLLNDREQRVRKAVESRSIDALRIADGIGDEGEMSAVDQSHTVQEKQAHNQDHERAAAKGEPFYAKIADAPSSVVGDRSGGLPRIYQTPSSILLPGKGALE